MKSRSYAPRPFGLGWLNRLTPAQRSRVERFERFLRDK